MPRSRYDKLPGRVSYRYNDAEIERRIHDVEIGAEPTGARNGMPQYRHKLALIHDHEVGFYSTNGRNETFYNKSIKKTLRFLTRHSPTPAAIDDLRQRLLAIPRPEGNDATAEALHRWRKDQRIANSPILSYNAANTFNIKLRSLQDTQIERTHDYAGLFQAIDRAKPTWVGADGQWNLRVTVHMQSRIVSSVLGAGRPDISQQLNFFDDTQDLNIIEDYEEFTDINDINILYIEIRREKRANYIRLPGQDREGGFFPMYIKDNTVLDKVFTKYQIFTKPQMNEQLHKHIIPENCLVHTLIQTGLVGETAINQVKLAIAHSEVRVRNLGKVAQIIGCKLILRRFSENEDRYLKKVEFGTGDEINIGLFAGHYFLDERVKITAFSIKNFEAVREDPEWQLVTRIKDNGYFVKARKSITGITSRKLVRLAHKYNLFEDITDVNYLNRNRQKTAEYDIFKDLTYPEQSLVKCGEQKDIIEALNKKNERVNIVYYADTETQVDQPIHKAYMISWCGLGGSNMQTLFTKDIPEGSNMFAEFLKRIPGGAIVYFHNLIYDLNVLTNLMRNVKISNLVKKNGLVYSVKIGFAVSKTQMNWYTFKDSYCMTRIPLANFGKTYGLKQTKAPFPYTLIRDNLPERVDLRECLDHIKPNDKDEFIRIVKNNNEFYHKGKVNIFKYAKFYCELDVELLAKGFEVFRGWMLDEINIDIHNYLTVSSISDAYLKYMGCYEGCYELTGTPMHFIEKCIIGGRVMTRANKMIKTTGKNIVDFDGVSLYPSAMVRMPGFLKGKPMVVYHKNIEWLSKKDGYFIQIMITKVNRHRDFPLIYKRDKNGILQYTNSDNTEMFVDKTYMQMLIKYHEIEYKIIKGYFFNNGFNTKIRKVQQDLFNLRLKYKERKNPVQTVCKLILNAGYGKNIQKPVKEKYVFLNDADLRDYTAMNYNKIVGLINKVTTDTWCVTERKDFVRHSSRPHIASEILSHSKLIMEEVFEAMYENNKPVFYQDTDSMHIYEDSVKLLEAKYKAKYGRELIGKQLGQFHSDFELKGAKHNIVSTESMFLGKKCYIDHLLNKDNGETGYHIRMKGVPHYCLQDNNKNPWEIYEKLFNGKEITFDLLADNHVSFQKTADFNMLTRTNFTRKGHYSPEIEREISSDEFDYQQNKMIRLFRKFECPT